MASEDGVSAVGGTCVTINLLMGSGFLALPAVFQRTGLLFSIVTLAFVGFIMCITCCWEGRAVLRGQYKLSLPKVPEVTETLRLFCGNFASNSYLFILSVSFIGAVWAYAILFAESVSSNFPLIYTDVECINGNISTSACYIRYLLNLTVFAVFTTPLSLMEVKDQAYFQAFITVMIMTLIVVMCGTSAYAHSMGQMAYCFPNSYLVHGDAPVVADGQPETGSVRAYFACISACIFSVYLNGCVPVVAGSLRNKGDLDRVLSGAIAIACVFYGSLYIVASCFGSHIDPLSNLNWRGFRWPAAEGGVASHLDDVPVSASAKFVEMFVVLFPALVVLSVYPLSTKIVASSFLEVVYGAEAVALATVGESGYAGDGSLESGLDDHIVPSSGLSYQQKETTPLVGQSESTANVSAWTNTSRIMLAIRVAINLMPILCAAFIPNFLSIIVYVGAMSVVICLVYPAVLSVASVKAMGPYVSVMHSDWYVPPCDDWLEHPTLQMGLLGVGGILSLVIIAVNLNL